MSPRPVSVTDQRVETRRDTPLTPDLVRVRGELAAATPIVSQRIDDLSVELASGGEALWLFVRRADSGGVALRAASWPGAAKVRRVKRAGGELARVHVESAIGAHEVALEARPGPLPCLRLVSTLRPSAPLLLPPGARDLFPFYAEDDPMGTRGTVEAVQRGLNAGLLYGELTEPAFGTFFYFQDFTALNPYFQATGTNPDAAVGGIWPGLGFRLPGQTLHTADEAAPLAPRITYTLSDARLVVRDGSPADERDSARRFLQMLGAAYRSLSLPPTDYRDWRQRAARTARHLGAAPEATVRHYGHRYIHPYTDAEYPDAMVQMSIVQALHDWGKWRCEVHPLEEEFKAGLGKFYDPKLETLRRYLPNVGDDKDADAVDSWYLYHPLLNLGKLALDGDAKARRLFLKSLPYAIRAARHFTYKWPIQYKITDFSVITETAGADGRGQTDVGGIYAWVMLEAFELTDEKLYLDEACAAIDTAVGLGFDINYQANLTAWGAAACMRLWRVTGRDVYREQSYVYLASFFHHTEIWESEIGLAVHHRNFLGATCLQDAPYMAIYECFDSFAAFEHYLADSGPDLEPAARMLISEYCRYALDRAWFYYPDALPAEAVSDEQRPGNGCIDPALSFPVEDLYADGQPAGQVGQEVYGAGAAFIFATRAFHHVDGAPFDLYCDHFVRALERMAPARLSLRLDGGEGCTARLSFVRKSRGELPAIRVAAADGDAIRPDGNSGDRLDFLVPANGSLLLSWN